MPRRSRGSAALTLVAALSLAGTALGTPCPPVLSGNYTGVAHEHSTLGFKVDAVVSEDAGDSVRTTNLHVQYCIPSLIVQLRFGRRVAGAVIAPRNMAIALAYLTPLLRLRSAL